MKLTPISALLTGVVLATAASVAQADAYYFESGSATDIPDVSTYKTMGDMMDGLKITAVFANFTETAIWGGTTSGSGEAVGTGWSLKLSGDSFNNNWYFNTTGNNGALLSLRLDGTDNFTLFDRTFDNQVGTPNSALGKDFKIFGDSGFFDYLVTYYDPVGVTPNAPVGDLFKAVQVDFDPGYLATSFNFEQDTDNDSRALPPVPEAETYAMMLAGLGLVGFAVSRRRKAA